MAVPLLCERKTFAFLFLSLLDLLLTWWLLEQGDGRVYEGNPIARWWLVQAGWLGLAAFKLGAVLLVGALAAAIACLRPRTGAFVLTFACFVLGGVVLYSSSLAGVLAAEPEDDSAAVAETGVSLTQEISTAREYRELLGQVKDDLLARRCTLDEGVRRLQQSSRGLHDGWWQVLHDRYPGLTDEACLAANLIQFAVSTLESNPQEAVNVDGLLRTEFARLYRTRPAW
jgi:hypothetical protein